MVEGLVVPITEEIFVADPKTILYTSVEIKAPVVGLNSLTTA